MKKIQNTPLNLFWDAGFLAMSEKVLGIGLLISLPFLHWPLLFGYWTVYLTYPFNLVFVGHIILTTA
ncbi:MAG: hypothetical protein P1Q69_15110, partial [Candidatus Thorarchaeota archaeon]|nr:hypothetical protein [Candidatus Thorarchaeota archaeon]